MTTDKIIAAAREAGFRTGNITLTDSEIAPIPFIAPLSATDCQHEVGRLYAIAYRAGMERAAEICKKELNYPNEQAGIDMALWNAIDNILSEAHAKNQTEGRATNG